MNPQLSIDFNTKLHSYRTISDKNTKQQTVLAAFVHLKKASDKDVANYLGWSINCVIPRRSELMANGMLVIAGVKMGQSNKPNKVYELNNKV